jgi:BirA family biotin operon repressor/biotin-[acetyl-CoA-carboxylase] ligase
LLISLDIHYNTFLNEKYPIIIKEWKRHSDTLGKKVEILGPSIKIIGEALDINSSGSLILKEESGSLKTIFSGDLNYYEKKSF